MTASETILQHENGDAGTNNPSEDEVTALPAGDSTPRLLPVMQGIRRRGRDLELFLNLWRMILTASLTVVLLVEWAVRGTLARETEWGLFGVAAILLLSLGLQIYLGRAPWSDSIHALISGAEVATVTTLLLGCVVINRAIAATNSQLIFPAYFLVVVLAAVRSEPKVVRRVALAVPLSYAMVVFLAVAWRQVHFAAADPVYGIFRWHSQVARLILLLGAAWIVHLDVAMRSTDRAQALHDPLTGLYNRRFLEELLARELPRARRYSRHLALLLLDLDGFKAFNDTHGHLAGDRVLEEVAICLSAAVRAGDTVVRFGGDEFVVVLPDTPGETARRVARELAHAMPRPVGLSVGVGCLGEGVGTVEQLISAADAALMRAKQAGGGTVEVG
jgi:diguanylate cyclase (GGDEF)-like protein